MITDLRGVNAAVSTCSTSTSPGPRSSPRRAGSARCRGTASRCSSFLPPVVDTATYDGQAVRRPVRHQRRSAPLPQGRPRRGGRPAAPHLGRAGAVREDPRAQARIDGYAGQFLPYEGLTVNAAEAVYSAGGTILGDEGERVTVGRPRPARASGSSPAVYVRAGYPRRRWSTRRRSPSRPSRTAGCSSCATGPTRTRCLRRGLAVAGKIGAVPLPGPDGPGTSVLGGSNLAVSSHARHPDTAARLIAYLTSERVQRKVLTRGALPPVRAELYEDPELVREFPYLPTLRAERPRSRTAPQEPALRPGRAWSYRRSSTTRWPGGRRPGGGATAGARAADRSPEG